MSNNVFNFNFLTLLLSEIFTLGGRPTPPGRPLAEKNLPKANTLQYLIVFLIPTF